MTPGQVVNWLFLLALSHVEGHGLKLHWCISLINSEKGIEVCTLFAAAVHSVYCSRSCFTFVYNGINIGRFLGLVDLEE